MMSCPGSFRLIRLLSSGECTLTCANPQEEYVAIYHVWTKKEKQAAGANADPSSVVNMLRLLGHEKITRREKSFWIETVCIMQNSTEDKQLHIPKMHEIYSNAKHVIVLLSSTEGDHLKKCVRLLKINRKILDDANNNTYNM